MRLLLGIARTHLTSRLKQSIIAGLGVTFGIGMFIILISFMTGLNGLLDGLILDRTPHIHIYNEIAPTEVQPLDRYLDGADWGLIRSIKPKLTPSRIYNGPALLRHFKQDDRIKGATAQVSSQVFYTAGSIQLNGMVNGIDIREESRLFNIDNYIIEGDILDLHHNDNAIILGAGIVNKLSAKINDRVKLVSATGNTLSLKIVGIYQSGMAEIDNVQSYANLHTVQRLVGERSNYITSINVKLEDITSAPGLAEEMRRLYDVDAIDIYRANAQFDTGTSIRNLITYAVSIALLIVAGFGIYNILNMLIFEKMNDIAILKATGFSGKDVMIIFLAQAIIIGVSGGVVGLILGYAISVLIDHTPFVVDALPTVKTYPVNFDITYYMIGILFALISTTLAGFLPARKAKNIDPVDILRGQ